MEPPPAPISISSIVEMRIGRPLPSMKRFWRAASKAYAVSGSPPSTRLELGGRAAHVEGEQVAAAVLAAEEGGGQRAGGRARFEHLHRRALGLGHVGEAAAREHEQQRRRDAERRRPGGPCASRYWCASGLM